ncbi:hypothetical protein B0J18DRAFT_183739 [Chaetomium sp. MPI-SDFR-AT-0129]|nr:hypothetical protein B0J18DRAFT_183739 [Chaetomium sp. MPI-SDFR-AT-0129]
MVYCGKASKGCQNCRIRRIKCDRVQPQCTQCVRVRKTCPGYRDPLSLMFRDESTKVMQKAQAQWQSETWESSSSSSSSPDSTRNQEPIPESTAPPPAAVTANDSRKPAVSRGLTLEIGPTAVDKAIRFFVDRYVIGLPDEPRAGHELQEVPWVHSPRIRDILAAVGMAGMSNLTGDKEMSTLAKHHYGLALQRMAGAVRDVGSVELEMVMRTVVMMAMYEVIAGTDGPARSIHIMGAAAILRNALPAPQLPSEGPRALLQLCFSTLSSKQSSTQHSSSEPNVLIPTHIDSQCDPLPPALFGWIAAIDQMASDEDKPSAELVKIIARFVQLSTGLRSHRFLDGHPKTADTIREALDINLSLKSWAQQQDNTPWAFTEEHIDPPFFPPGTVFDNSYHIYTNTYIARAWNHYRWTHILTNQLLLEAATRFPITSTTLLPPSHQHLARDLITHLARDTLVSVPTHYRHPKLEPKHWDCFDKTNPGAVLGLPGVPTVLFQVKVAACAPGVCRRYREWALEMLETAWRDLGMVQARVLAGFVRESTSGVKEECE